MLMHPLRPRRALAELLSAAYGEALAAQPGATADDARGWLARTDEALSSRNYRGVFVHEYANETETLQVVQRVGPDGVSERLQSLDGSGREFIRRGTQLLCYLPDRRLVLVEHIPSAGLLLGRLPSLQAALTGEYDVSEVQRTRVSGRTARVIAIEPRDQLRYGYRVWIDEATAMPLRTQLRDARGHMLEQIVFTSLTLPVHIAASELLPGVDARKYRWVQQDVPTATDPSAPAVAVSWEAGALPPGFRMTASATQMMPGGPAEHLVFSDGLASVSVFVQARSNAGRDASAAAQDDAATLGTSSAYSTAAKGYRITVVGEVPPQTVRDIAQAISSAVPPAAAAAAVAESGLDVPSPPRALAASPPDSPFHGAPTPTGRDAFGAPNVGPPATAAPPGPSDSPGLTGFGFSAGPGAGVHLDGGGAHRR
jgi:sigma-E factor negative regulatory protein RseB